MMLERSTLVKSTPVSAAHVSREPSICLKAARAFESVGEVTGENSVNTLDLDASHSDSTGSAQES
jgi:hypothetical protein